MAPVVPARATRRAAFSGYPFSLGVASGSPLPTGIVLWTRLAPEPLDGGGMGDEAVDVRWEVAEDERFARVARRGTVAAQPEGAHSVHVEVERLQPDRWYFYRFIAGDEVSPVGRTRTAPAEGSLPGRLRVGLGSCQHYEYGYFAAHRHLVAERLDLMVFVGDYIYEGGGNGGRVRRHAGAEARSLAQYRNRHALYKTDRDLQDLHAAVPWLLTWDDHEVDNDYAGTHSNTLGPDFARRRAAAYQAYFEHMPLRRVARPREGGMVVRSRHDWGRLARFHLLDGRQFRSPQACPPPGRGGSHKIDERCRYLTDASRTMLGPDQERWLGDGLRAAPERWNFIAQQTLMARAGVHVDGRRRFSSDAWDGYPAARDRLLGAIDDNRLGSCVVLSGDAHVAYVSDLKLDFDDPRAPPVATELCVTSITSPGRAQRATDAIVRQHPHIHYGDSRRRGYAVLDVTAERCVMRLRVIGDAENRRTGISTAARFRVDAGRPGANRL